MLWIVIMVKKQKYTLIILLSFIFLLILTSVVSFQKNTYYHNMNGDFYLSITEKYIQPFYNMTALFVWFAGIFFLILFTYIYFRNYNNPLYKKYSVDYKLLFKSFFIFVGILYFIGIFGEFYPSFYLGEEEIYLISETEYKENTNIIESGFDKFNKENWIEI